ncbi:MAG: UDP-N-acetylmuramate--L-alanine ligase [Defluviitaleaceae bacterium]|nr:UDP-N-acetylmuramate--L-alanine ligase [Defluviitaleaceae bacterium]
MKKINLPKNIHFIGIGGVSMSGIATILNDMGHLITGSDRDETETTKKLKSLGIEVKKGHSSENIPKETKLIVYTAAIKETNEEFKYAKDKNIPLMKRAELLGIIISAFENSICIAGTHGKTTTTAMLAHMLTYIGVSPTISIGAHLESIGGNFLLGNSNYFVTEACEYAGSFLSFFPKIALILNTDYDHTDYYKTPEELQNAFLKFANGAKQVIWGSNVYISKDLELLGEHNKHNWCCALEVIKILGLDLELAKESIKTYKAPKRRLELKGETKDGLIIIDDYAHHPNEIIPTLKAIKEKYVDKKIYVLYQPHTYSRTSSFLKEFSTAFEKADHTFILPIYAAREENIYNIYSENIVNITPNSTYVSSEEDFLEIWNKKVLENSLLITMGATDVYKIGDGLLST